MDTIRNFPKLFRLLIAAAIILAAGSASAVESPQQGAKILLDTYHRNMAGLETTSFGLPLFVESFERDHTVHVDVYGIFDYPFSSIAAALKVPANWCDIVSLHPNIKAAPTRNWLAHGCLPFTLAKKPTNLRKTRGKSSTITGTLFNNRGIWISFSMPAPALTARGTTG